MQYIILIFDHFWFACMSANHFLITYNNTSLSEPIYIRHRPKQIKTLNSCICHTAHSEKTQTDIPGRVKTLGVCIRWFFIEMLCKRTWVLSFEFWKWFIGTFSATKTAHWDQIRRCYLNNKSSTPQPSNENL